MDGDIYQVHDLLSDARYIWRGRRNYVELDPRDSAGPHLPGPALAGRRDDLFERLSRRDGRLNRLTVICIPPGSSIVSTLSGMKIFSLSLRAIHSWPDACSLVPDLPHTKTILDALIAAGPVMIRLFALSIFS